MPGPNVSIPTAFFPSCVQMANMIPLSLPVVLYRSHSVTATSIATSRSHSVTATSIATSRSHSVTATSSVTSRSHSVTATSSATSRSYQQCLPTAMHKEAG
eukprot:scaffold126772_cov16-Tisochrysis_lutea.AAC.1